MDSTTFAKLSNTLAIAKADEQIKIIEAQLQMAKIDRELAVAHADLFNSGANDMSPETKKPKRGTQAATKAAAKDDLEKVKAAAAKVEEAVTEKTATDLDAEVKLDEVYKEGSVNLLGFLAPLHLLTPEARKPYIVDVELNKTKHTEALEHGVLHLDLVQEVLDNMGTPAEKHENPAVTHEGIRSKVGADLVDHMTSRVAQETLKRDLTTLFKAVK